MKIFPANEKISFVEEAFAQFGICLPNHLGVAFYHAIKKQFLMHSLHPIEEAKAKSVEGYPLYICNETGVDPIPTHQTYYAPLADAPETIRDTDDVFKVQTNKQMYNYSTAAVDSDGEEDDYGDPGYLDSLRVNPALIVLAFAFVILIAIGVYLVTNPKILHKFFNKGSKGTESSVSSVRTTRSKRASTTGTKNSKLGVPPASGKVASNPGNANPKSRAIRSTRPSQVGISKVRLSESQHLI